MSLFSDLTNIYDNDLDNIHGMEVFYFINRNKDKVDEIDKNITAEIISKNKKINTLTTANHQKVYQISKLKKETLQKDQRIAELEAKIKQVSEEFNKQHELLDQYELECTDEIVRLKNQKISELEAKLEEVEGQYAYECECNKQLVELQEENKKLESYNSQLRENYEKCIDTWKQENAKLKEQLKTKTWEVEELMHERKRLENDYMKLYEQLKNAILPKFKIDDEVYHIRSWSKEIIKAKVNNINVYIVKGYDNFEYGLREWCEEDKRYQSYVGDMKDEELVFATKAEAQKYLEEHK